MSVRRLLVRLLRSPVVSVAASLLVAGLAGTASAGGFGRAGLDGPGGVFAPGRSEVWRRPTPAESLAGFTARKGFEARVARLNLLRDAERRTEERRLARSGTPAELAAYRRRIQREDQADDLELRVEAQRLFAAQERAKLEHWWESLGPVTRDVLLRSGLDLRQATREAERDARLRDVERKIESRRPSAASRLFGPAAP